MFISMPLRRATSMKVLAEGHMNRARAQKDSFIATYDQMYNKDRRNMSLCMDKSLPLFELLEHCSGSTVNLDISYCRSRGTNNSPQL